MLSVLANRTYRHLFAAQALSLIGTGLTTVALGLLAYDLAGADAGAVLGTALALKMITYVGIAPIAGDLVEEEDAEPEPVRLPNGSIEFDGMTPIDEAAEVLVRHSMMEGGDYTTIAGFVLWRLGRIPEENETFEWEGWRFTVVALQGHRIETVLATPSSEQASAQLR